MNECKQKTLNVNRKKFRSSTLNFIFIIVYVNIFQLVFGAENSIVGVIFTIMMSASMVRDLTAEPLGHLFLQSFVLIWMAVSAFLVTTLSVPFSFFINFFTLLLILYAFTYEYSNHLYFPYILSYLFLIFISPVHAHQLPKRLTAMFAGAVSIILYQWIMGRKRVVETARDVLTEMIDTVSPGLSGRILKEKEHETFTNMHHKLCLLGRAVYDRKKKTLCISDASFSMLSAGRGLVYLLSLMLELPESFYETETAFLKNISSQLCVFRSFLQNERTDLPALKLSDCSNPANLKMHNQICNAVQYIQHRLLHMTDPQKKSHYRKTMLSLKVRFQIAFDFSPVRAAYSFRTALLLALASMLVLSFFLPHGKWLLFTLASVSLPYADDIPSKMKKRLSATLIGGIFSVLLYSLISSPTGRTMIMMLSGYVSFYFTDYRDTFACSTVGALGGAVFLNSVGFSAVGNVFLIRLSYILAGVLIAYVVNILIFPFTRSMATRQLFIKYQSITDHLKKLYLSSTMDYQLYYHLVIQSYLVEEKLIQNTRLEKEPDFFEILSVYQKKLLYNTKETVPQIHP